MERRVAGELQLRGCTNIRARRWFRPGRVDVSSVADVSEIHAVSVFRVNVSRVNECSRICLWCYGKES
jgi:hypothetical protein